MQTARPGFSGDSLEEFFLMKQTEMASLTRIVPTEEYDRIEREQRAGFFEDVNWVLMPVDTMAVFMGHGSYDRRGARESFRAGVRRRSDRVAERLAA